LAPNTFTNKLFPTPPTGSSFSLSYAAAPTGVVLQASGSASISAAPNPLAFGNQAKGTTSTAMTLTFSNAGAVPLMITGGLVPTGGNATDFAQVAGVGTCGGLPITIAAGGNCTVQYTFSPSVAGMETTSLQVANNSAVTPYTVTLNGTGTVPTISAAPNPLAFSNQPQGITSAGKTLTFSNAGGAPLTITGGLVPTGGNAADFAQVAGAGTCGGLPITIPAGGNCTVQYTFTPTAMPVGSETSTLQVANNSATTPFAVTLSGTGINPTVTYAPTAAAGVNFGAVAPGTTTAVFTETITVTAGTGNLQLSSITIATTTTGAGANDFAFAPATTCPTGGGTVNAGTNCVVAMTFTPAIGGTENGTLTITGTNLTGSPVVIPLTGIGSSTAAGFNFTVQPNAGGGSGAVVTLSPGETAIFPLIITPNTGFIGPITVTCGTLTPATNTTLCSAAPVPVNITVSPSPAVTVFLTFQTNCAPVAMAPRAPGSQPSVPAPPVAAVLLLAVLVAMRRGRGYGARGWAGRLAPVCGMVLLVLLVMTWTACVKDPPNLIPGAPTTPAGTYTLPVTATAPGGVTKTITLTINVT
ncbi:MAG TPA: choice-of-anchor D domain-containing protein, partial [Candidatus Acidoferrales bacterium]|nr:choice-of-anchor D domain-containing protein [Candidatus Acidoferrales bacterium]